MTFRPREKGQGTRYADLGITECQHLIHFNSRQRHQPKNLENEKMNSLPPDSSPGALSAGASLTVEAALSLSVFLFLCGLFFTFFLGQLWQLRLQKALDDICEDVAVWSYAVDFAESYTGTNLMALADGGLISGAMNGDGESLEALLKGEADPEKEILLFLRDQGAALIWQTLLKEWLIGKIGRDKLDTSVIEEGADGLSLFGSTLAARDLDLVLHYRIRSPLSFPFRLSYPVVQRVCRRLWTGTPVKEDDEEEESGEAEENLVFITETGSVYHLSRDCRVLALKKEWVAFTDVGTLRNTSGGKYYACGRCAKGREAPAVVIITIPGVRYHFEENCPSLKRTIAEIALSDAQEKYRPCHYCGGSP